jgi:hypothetical protein
MTPPPQITVGLLPSRVSPFAPHLVAGRTAGEIALTCRLEHFKHSSPFVVALIHNPQVSWCNPIASASGSREGKTQATRHW